MKRTAIVILNYKNFQDTINCINSILNSPSNEYLIIVVDNYSKNDSLAEIEKAFEKKMSTKYWAEDLKDECNLLLVQHKENNGYAAGNNIGLKIGYDLGYEYLLVLNNDTLFVDDCLNILIADLQSKANTLCIGPLLIKDNGSIDYNCAKRRPEFSDFFILSYFGKIFKTDAWVKNYYYLKQETIREKSFKVDIISGSCMLFRAKLLVSIDFFDEKTFLYFEEAIISEKAMLNNYSIFLNTDAKVIHLGAQSTKLNTVSAFSLNCEYESAIYYLVKWRGVNPIVAKLLCLPMLAFIKLKKLLG